MTLPFNNRLDIGEEIERKTADYIVQHLDADVEKIGSLEIDTVKPLTWRNIEGVTRRLIAPDLNIYKDGQYFSVQVKHKTAVIYADSFTGSSASILM